MNALSLRILLLTVVLTICTKAADVAPEPAAPAPKPVTADMIRARLAEHIKTKNGAKPAAPTEPLTATSEAQKSPSATPATTAAPAPSPTTPAALADSKSEPAAVLPKVEVRRTRVTEIEREVFQQEREIEREKKNTKSSDVDRALNAPSKAFSIFGGESTRQRETVAQERVSLMESERDIMEAIAHAKTKEEKEELRKELTELKAMRRDLEKALR